MDTKLTLQLSNSIIEKAKIYAKSHNISLSKMIESYLDSLTKENGTDEKTTPLVESLSGIIELPSNFDYKKKYGNYLNDKYN